MLLRRPWLPVQVAATSLPADMIRETRQLRVLLVAAEAPEDISAAVLGADVFIQFTGLHETSTADAARVRLCVAAVGAHVRRQQVHPSERLPTLAAAQIGVQAAAERHSILVSTQVNSKPARPFERPPTVLAL